MTATEPPRAADDRLWLFDVNVLVALAVTSHVHHRPAHAALAAHPGPWATCPTTEAALLRLLLNPQVTHRAVSRGEALRVLVGMRAETRWRWLADGTSLADPVIDTTVLVGHQQVTDLHLVNLAASSTAVLVTFDAGLVGALAPADRRHVLVLPQ